MASLNGMQIWRLDIKFNYALLQKAGANTAIKKILNRSLGRDATLSLSPSLSLSLSYTKSSGLFRELFWAENNRWNSFCRQTHEQILWIHRRNTNSLFDSLHFIG